MDEKKSRTLLFLLGISIGLLVGATVVYLSTPKTSSNGEVSETMIEQVVSKVYSLISLKKEAQDSLSQQEIAAKTEKSKLVSSSKNKESLKGSAEDSSAKIAVNTGVLADTSRKDTSTTHALSLMTNTEDIVVKKDELLLSKSIELTNLDYLVNKAVNHNDSLLQAVSGVRDQKLAEAKSTFQVELWQSPINYKGYKMSKTKLVLFGIDDDAPLRLILLDKNTYLKCADSFYKIENYTDFKSFEKVSNTALISQLNK